MILAAKGDEFIGGKLRLDGPILPANLGMDPSLTITTLAEYILAQFPEKEKNDA